MSRRSVPILGVRRKLSGSLGILTGADAGVLDHTFNAAAYVSTTTLPPIPAETGPTADPLSFGAVGNGTADDTNAVQNAMNSLPSTGGVLDLSTGIFGVVRNTNDVIAIGNKSNITIKGGGWSDGVAQTSGLRSINAQVATNNGFDAILRYTPSGNNQNLVIRDLELDGNGRPIGGITTQNENGAWIIGCYLHDFGNGTGNTLAIIKGADTQTGVRYIGNLISDSGATSGSALRGIFMTDEDGFDTWIAHNIVRRTGHTGIAPTQGDGLGSTIEFNTTIRNGQSTGGAGVKPEMSNLINKATFNPANGLIVARRNYCTMERSASGLEDFPFQIETMGLLMEENILADATRGIASFDEFRNNEVRNNVFELMDEYGVYLDANESGQDKTGNVIENNTITRDGRGMTEGILFFDWDNTPSGMFGFDNGLIVRDNKIVDALTTPIVTSAQIDAYVAGDPGSEITNNGPSALGATVVLLPPSYV